MGFVVHDIEDGTYLTRAYFGEREEELWLIGQENALVFDKAAEAQLAIDSCDEDERLRYRLFVESAVPT